MRMSLATMGFLVSAVATQAVQAQEGDDPAQDQQHHEDDVGVIEIECHAANDFGYVAQVHGTLGVTGLAEYGLFRVRGELMVKTWFYDDREPEQAQSVTVQGSVGASYLNAEVRSGGELTSMLLAFQSPMSQVNATNGTNYQTDCSQSVVELPKVADLIPLDTLRFTDLANGSQAAQISVLNNGSVALTEGLVQVRIAGHVATGALFESVGGGTTLEPLQQGYIEVELPAATLARCGEYEVTVDFDQRLQSGPFDPFSNDTERQTTPCLRWNTTITVESLGTTPDPLIEGKSLGAIVSSEVAGRVDNNGNLQLCSACHFAGGSTQRYHAPAGPITPNQNTDGWAWNAAGGWADQFRAQSFKPEYLKQAFLRWQQDGAL